MTAGPAQVQGTPPRAGKCAGQVGISVRPVWLSIRSCELQTLAPRLPPFTDTPHPPSLICWASHELAGLEMIGRCVTAQPACAYPAAQAGTQHVPLLALHGTGGLAGNAVCVLSCLVSLHQESRFTRSQIIFFWLPRRCCRIGNFFSSSLFLKSLSQSQTLQYIPSPTRCRWCHFATAIRALRTICFCSLLAPDPTRSLVRP